METRLRLPLLSGQSKWQRWPGLGSEKATAGWSAGTFDGLALSNGILQQASSGNCLADTFEEVSKKLFDFFFKFD